MLPCISLEVQHPAEAELDALIRILSGVVCRCAGAQSAQVAVRDFDWARDDYSPFLRTAAIWSFILSCRLRLTLDSQKWTYPGGMTPER